MSIIMFFDSENRKPHDGQQKRCKMLGLMYKKYIILNGMVINQQYTYGGAGMR